MKVYLKCKCGAKRSFLWNIATMPEPEKALKEGWRSRNGELLCPLCAGFLPDDEIDDPEDTNSVMWKTLFDQLPKRRP